MALFLSFFLSHSSIFLDSLSDIRFAIAFVFVCGEVATLCCHRLMAAAAEPERDEHIQRHICVCKQKQDWQQQSEALKSYMGKCNGDADTVT